MFTALLMSLGLSLPVQCPEPPKVGIPIGEIPTQVSPKP